jgi:hypothetical protein
VGDVQAWRDALAAHHATHRTRRTRRPAPAITGIRIPPREEVNHMSDETTEPEAEETETPEAEAAEESDEAEPDAAAE